MCLIYISDGKGVVAAWDSGILGSIPGDVAFNWSQPLEVEVLEGGTEGGVLGLHD